MLRFIPKTEKAYTDVGIFKFHLYQGCDVGRGAPQIAAGGQSVLEYGNCEFCRYLREWSLSDNLSSALKQCILKHKCQATQYPLIEMSRPLNDQWDEWRESAGGDQQHFEPSALIRQVTFEGQPLYIQFYAQEGYQANCNALCWWHSWRLDNKKTWRQCAKTHKCWQDGSGWALMAPTNDELYRDFCNQM